MEKKSVTVWLAEYIQLHAISVEQTAKDTGISQRKLRPNPVEKLNAAEFLELCFYLSITPEEIQKEMNRR